MFYVYVLKSKRDEDLYTGSTNNLKKRLKEHNDGKVKSTKNRVPLMIIYYEAGMSEIKAKKKEKYLKTSWGKRYLKNRI